VSENIVEVGKEIGLLQRDKIPEVSLEQGSKTLWGMDPDMTELGFGCRARTDAVVSRQIGWQPKNTRADFLSHFTAIWKLVSEQK
jgi:hypothetical protein